MTKHKRETVRRETAEEKALRKALVEDAGCACAANAVQTVKDTNRGWREMSSLEWNNAVYAEKISQHKMFADQFHVEPDEVLAEMGLL